MNFKRVLTMLLALCMMVNMFVPGVSAITAGSGNFVAQTQTGASQTLTKGEEIHVTTAKDADKTESETASGEGTWTATRTDIEPGADLMNTELPQGVKELAEAAELYAADETVAAFIVLEDAPLAEKGYASINAVPASKENAMLAVQNKLISTISKKVLDGAELDVRYQFTYLSNAISVNVAFGHLAEIARLDGVKTVFLMPVYEPATVENETNTASGGEMVGVPSVWEDLGYTGAGCKIAIVDTGLDLDHPSFAAAPALNENSLTVEDIEAVLPKLNASALYPAATAEDLYHSDKVPFAFNYIDENLRASHDFDQQGDHGSHVAGISAANKTEGTTVVGVAPDAQVVVMKVFGVGGGAYQDDLMAAIEDALLLDVDVINMSLGSPSGFSSEDPEVDAIYSRVNYTDVILAISAGNETQSSAGNLWGTDLNTTDNPDSGVAGSPSTWGGAISVASAENDFVFSTYFTVGENAYGYTDASGLYTEFRSLAGQELEYVMVPGLGEASDFEGLDVAGKIAVISRGTINFSLKLYNAEQAGAVGCIIYNNVAGSIGLQMTDEEGNLNDGISGLVPCVSVSMATGEALAAAENKKLVVSAEDGPVASASGGQMSLFSSWGVTPSLELKPEITAIGGNMYSCYDGGQYGLMSGTSMSSPQLAGVAALVLQYLAQEHPDLADAEERAIAQSLLMSTATPIISADSGVEASPRQQGAGLVNAEAAVTAEAYLTVKGEEKPKAELGDDPAKSGSYSFTFDIHNFSDAEQTYALSASLLTEDVTDFDGAYEGVEFMAGCDRALTGEVIFSQDSVTVAPNGSARVDVLVKLSAEDKAWMDEHYANGIYVEGFVYATNTEGTDVDLGLPFLGFYGDWTQAPSMDTGFWYDIDFWGEPTAAPSSSQYFHTVWTDLNGTGWVLGYSPYNAEKDIYGYDPANNVVSPNGDSVMDNISEIYVSLLRSAKTLTFTFTDAETGETYFETTNTYARKSSYMGAYGQIVPYLYSWYNYETYDFTDADGNPLPNNAKVNLTVSATGDYNSLNENLEGDSWTVPITVDTQAPELLSVESASDAEGNYLVLTVSENVNLADVFVMNAANTRILAEYPESVKNEDGTFTVKMDITGLGTEFLVILCDYGANESAYTMTFTGDDNLPELEDGLLYAYRVMDQSYADDSLYGWVTIDPATAEVTPLTSDIGEYYALTAAEYAGGYIFAVDAGYNLVALVPGLWNRIEICNLGFSVSDMTFDPTTNTMYLVAKQDYSYSLMTLDLQTGETAFIADLGSQVYSIAATDDGELYAIKAASAKLWKMNWETMQLEEALAFEGNEYPYYSQSMTYDAENDCLYWAYCSYVTTGLGLYTIDLSDSENLTYTKAEFANPSEFVGLLMIDDGVEVPECDGTDCPSAQFEDVELESWYHAAVDYVVGSGYMNGTSETAFSPAMTTNRAMVVTVLYRMAGEPAVEGGHAFTDVPSGSFYENAVIWGVQNGIVNGKSAVSFAPGDAVTREEMVTFLYRFAKHMGYDVTSRYDSLAAFVDAGTVSSYAAVPMKWAVGNGIINGMDATHLAPTALSNRAQFATILMRLYVGVSGGFRLPVGELEGLKLAPESILLSVGATETVSVNPILWNAKLGDVAFASTNEAVATVAADGTVTGVGAGNCEIVAVCGDFTASIPVRVVAIEGTIHAYNYYSYVLEYGNWITMDLSDLSTVTVDDATPVDFIAADYNGHEGVIYGFDGNYTLYSWNPTTGEVVTIGSAGTAVQITDMAYDYSTGTMYAVGVDNSYYTGGLYQVNTRTGELIQMGLSYDYLAFFGLAIDLEGNMYALDSNSCLYTMEVQSYVDEWTGETVSTLSNEFILDTGFGGLNYTQSMCYDHDHDQIIWAACGTTSALYWLDPATGDHLNLGVPGGESFFEFMGLYAVPAQIPELPVVALESAELADTLVVMENGSKAAPLSLNPLNATIDSITWTSADESIATVNAAGTVTGVSKGQTTVSVTIVSGENTVSDSMTVKVMESADNMYAYLMMDIATYGGDVFMAIDDTSPEMPTYLAAMDSGMTINGMEYYDGNLYAYAYDPYDWTATSRTFVTIDAETFTTVGAVDSGSNHFVYDMAYDYSTATMYALAGYGEAAPDLYMVNMNNGRLIHIADLEGNYKSLAISADGTAYVTSSADGVEDPLTYEYYFPNSMLYTMDLTNGAVTLVGDTGMKSNMYSSMAFDYDTGNLYWNTCFRQDFFSPLEAKFCVVDTETGLATALGTLGASGSQITGLYCVADSYPAEPETTLTSVTVAESLKILGVGESAMLEAWTIHPACGAEMTWSSDNEAVATVDENGNVTAVSAGVANVTVTANMDGVTVTDSCRVCVFENDASFLAFSDSASAWSSVGRLTPANVTTGISGEGVSSAAYVGDAIYGYDSNNQLFVITDETTMERTVIGGTGLEFDVPGGTATEEGTLIFQIRDMAYDAAADRLLVLGCKYLSTERGNSETYGGAVIYEADLQSGALTEIVTLSDVHSQYRGMTVDAEGTVYVYNSFDDNFSIVNMTTGEMDDLVSLQSLALYGDTESVFPMAYDVTTGLIYMLFTGNGSYYQMLTLDPATSDVQNLGNVGEVIYDEDTWTNNGPTFTALLIK